MGEADCQLGMVVSLDVVMCGMHVMHVPNWWGMVQLKCSLVEPQFCAFVTLG
jgi:hypothetical protein